MAMKQVLIEGWRGISQSFAMVNQYQLVELAKLEGLSLSHLDLPYSNPAWTVTGNDPSFPPEFKAVIKAVPAPVGQSFDTAYNISFPFRRPVTEAGRYISFMTGEFGLLPTSFSPTGADVDQFCRGEGIITVPSNWSRMKVIEYGFDPDRIVVVPHGVSSDVFSPVEQKGREEVRSQIGLDADHFVFLNVGAMTWNKGIDILLRAFVDVRKRHADVRLVLKDASTLYGIRGANVVATFMQENAELTPDILASIKVISSGLPLFQMRLLYGSADAYISPYRAEGFNLPVIEAIACGTPAIVTDGGATDDFCGLSTGWKVRSDQVQNIDKAVPGAGYHLEPRLDSLIEQMESAISEQKSMTESFAAARQRLVARFSWASAARQLEALF
jgi:glycosyltransferase involved in cell wall biosynthesis